MAKQLITVNEDLGNQLIRNLRRQQRGGGPIQRGRYPVSGGTNPDSGSVTYSGSCCCNDNFCLKVKGSTDPIKPRFYRFMLPAFRCACTSEAEADEVQLHPPEPEEGEEPEENPTIYTSDPIECVAIKGSTIACVQETSWRWSVGADDWIDPVNADDGCSCTAPKPAYNGTTEGQIGVEDCESSKTADGKLDTTDSFWRLTIVPTLTEAGCDTSQLEFFIGPVVVFRYSLTRNCGEFRPFCRQCTNSFTIKSCGPSHCEEEPPAVICVTPSVGELWVEGAATVCCVQPTIDGVEKIPRFVVLEVDLKPGTCANDCCAAASGTFVLEWNGILWEYRFGECFADSLCGDGDGCGAGDFDHVSLFSWTVGCGVNGMELHLNAFKWSMAAHPPGHPEIDCACGVDNCFVSNPLQLYFQVGVPPVGQTCFDTDGIEFPSPGTGLCAIANSDVLARVRALTELP